ncbi:MAG: DUF4177 domain-containing protein [Clostridia bacterium]|nr:DUF4177 domain-containing protein [Clostridia bacterium]
MVQYETCVLNGFAKDNGVRKNKTSEELAADITAACNKYAKDGWTLKNLAATSLGENYAVCRVILIFERPV